ncbi:MAG: YidC/Oxa1 family membrane protein insertase [Candidatus Magasanikbacteria bacterium]|jgi:YidC/Oxa1 family membrane protein insertase
MLSYIWLTFLYQPLFNALIWIYSNIAEKNLGWAVVWLTIFLRLVLLPLTIMSERNALKHARVEEEARRAIQAYKNDPVARKEEFRKIMKRHQISPWAKVVLLAIQVLVLILLYQVFMGGITGERVTKMLYPFIDYPGRLNIYFYGFNLGNFHDKIWAGIAAGYLLISLIVENRGKKKWAKGEMYYLLVFPLFTFFALWMLPMVKSLFILTTMIFSDLVTLIRKIIFPIKK